MASRHLFFTLALGVFFAGAFLRFHALDRQSLWDDEMSTIKTVAADRRGMMYRFRTYECHPPLYFLQLKAWEACGFRSLVRLRANSALWGSVGLILIFGLGCFYGGPALGFGALVLASFSPYHLAYSQELRPYAFAMALATAGQWLVEICVQSTSEARARFRAWGAGLAACWAALLYAHYWGAFVVAAQTVYGFWRARDARLRRRIVMAALVAGVLFSVWLPVVFEQRRVVHDANFWVRRFGIGNLFRTFGAYCSIFFNMASWSFYLPGRVWVLLLLALAFLAAFLRGLARPLGGVRLWLAALLVPWLLSLWEPSIYVWYRYPTLMLPAFFLLVAAGLMAMRPRWAAWSLAAILMASEAWGCRVYFTTYQKANPKMVVSYIHRIKTPKAVVVRPSYFADLFRFYDRETTASVDENLYDSPARRALLKGRQIILVAFDVPNDLIGAAFVSEFTLVSAARFPGLAHLGIAVLELKGPVKKGSG